MPTYIKPGTTPDIPITHDLDLTTVERVRFLFKQYDSDAAPTLIIKSYPDGAVTEVPNETGGGGTFYVPLTAEQTRLFIPRKSFFCEARIEYSNGKIPDVDIMEFVAGKTMWGVDEIAASDSA